MATMKRNWEKYNFFNHDFLKNEWLKSRKKPLVYVQNILSCEGMIKNEYEE